MEQPLGEVLGSLSIDARLLDEGVGQLVDEIVGEIGSGSWFLGHTPEIGARCLELGSGTSGASGQSQSAVPIEVRAFKKPG